jgi:hypothetical protein
MILSGLELLHPRTDARGDRKRDAQVLVRLEICGRQPVLHRLCELHLLEQLALGLSLDPLDDDSRVVE